MEEENEKRRQEVEWENQRLEEEKRRALKVMKEEGIIHGADYLRYSIDEINRITNYDFLIAMYTYMSQDITNQLLYFDLQDTRDAVVKRVNMLTSNTLA